MQNSNNNLDIFGSRNQKFPVAVISIFNNMA